MENFVESAKFNGRGRRGAHWRRGATTAKKKQKWICNCCDQRLKMFQSSSVSHDIIKLQTHHKWKISVCNHASQESTVIQSVDELWKGLKCRGEASHDQWKCVCVSTKFGHVTWLKLEIMCLFCHRQLPLQCPLFCQLARTINQLNFDSWKTFPLNLVQVCESIWKLRTFFQ